MPKFKFTATFTGEIEIDETDERFLQAVEDEHGDETGEFEPFYPDFAMDVLYEDFHDGPLDFIEGFDTAEIALEFIRTTRAP